MTYNIFNEVSGEYDKWFELYPGRMIYEIELNLLKQYSNGFNSLEIGVGTGRFSKYLNIDIGLDPSIGMLQIAVSYNRVGNAILAFGENLPFRDSSLERVYLITTISFLNDLNRVLNEVYRILKHNGRLIIAFIPRDSPWGRHYTRLGLEGHKIYSKARFQSYPILVELLERHRFKITSIKSTLFQKPNERINKRDIIVDNYDNRASFIVIESIKINPKTIEINGSISKAF